MQIRVLLPLPDALHHCSFHVDKSEQTVGGLDRQATSWVCGAVGWRGRLITDWSKIRVLPDPPSIVNPLSMERRRFFIVFPSPPCYRGSMAERRFCNPNVVGSTPIGSSRAKAHPNNSLLMTHRKDGAGLLMDMVHVTNASSRFTG